MSLGCWAPGTPGPCSGGACGVVGLHTAGLGVETWHPAGAPGAFGEDGLRQAGSERWPHGDGGALSAQRRAPARLRGSGLAWPASAGEDHAPSCPCLQRSHSCGVVISVNSRKISYRYHVHDAICMFLWISFDGRVMKKIRKRHPEGAVRSSPLCWQQFQWCSPTGRPPFPCTTPGGAKHETVMRMPPPGVGHGSSVPPRECVQEGFPIIPRFPFSNLEWCHWKNEQNRHFLGALYFIFQKVSKIIGNIWPVSQIYRAVSVVGCVDSVLRRGTGRFWKNTCHFFSLATIFLWFPVAFLFIGKPLLWCLEMSFHFSCWNWPLSCILCHPLVPSSKKTFFCCYVQNLSVRGDSLLLQPLQ